jgi:hypothetical protein
LLFGARFAAFATVRPIRFKFDAARATLCLGRRAGFDGVGASNTAIVDSGGTRTAAGDRGGEHEGNRAGEQERA